ncbi:MAG: HAD family hydrolase, partial [Pseudomonadota bacterium]
MTSVRARDYDLLVFDCDGVLVDSEHIYNAANFEALSAIGYETTSEDLVRRFTGVPYPAMFAEIERDRGSPLPGGFVETLNAGIARRFETELEAIAGIEVLLDAHDGPRCVASSTHMPELRQNLTHVGLIDRFEPHIYSASQVAHGKPAPDLFLFAAKSMGTAPGRCLVIEDSIAGVTAGVAAGMTVIGFIGA